jgi:RND family efflux transporter MFP subunit
MRSGESLALREKGCAVSSMGRDMNRRRWAGLIVVLLGLFAIGGIVALRIGQRSDAKIPKAVAPMQFSPADLVYVRSERLSRSLPLSGTLEPANQVVVKAKVSGNLREVMVREGESVRAGDVLARFDTTDLEAKRAVAQGALESAKAQLALAGKTREMNIRLLQEHFISQNAFDNAQSGYDAALGNVRSAAAQVELADIALRDATVAAPMRGTVAKRHAQPGEKVAFDAPLITLVDLSTLELRALVPASEVPALRIGMPVELTVDGFGARAFAGRIARINPATEAGTRSILVYIALINDDAALRGGMFADGRVALAASPPVAALPLDAIRTEAGQTYVWTIERGALIKRVITLGERDEAAGRAEVKTPLPADLPVLAARFAGLNEGDRVVVQGLSAPPSPAP